MADEREAQSPRDGQQPIPGASQAVVPARKLQLDQVVASPGIGGGVTFLPRTMQECLDFATVMSKSDFAIPPRFRNNPGACLAVTIQSCRWEADPFGVIQKAYITRSKDGSERLSYEAQLFAAIVNTRAPLAGRLKLVYSGEGATRKVKVVGTFLTGEEREVETPAVGKIGVKNSPLWISDPDQQLAYYGIRAWARRWVPELMLGIYSPEEFEAPALVDAQRPMRGQVIEGTRADEGVEHVVEEETPVEVRASAEDILAQAENLTPKPDEVGVPITADDAAKIDATRHGIGGEGLEVQPGDDDPRDPVQEPSDEALAEWTTYAEASSMALSATGEDELKTLADLDEFAERVKATLKQAPISENDRDDLRARFVSAYLMKRREKFGRKR